MNPKSTNSPRFICVFTEKIEKYEAHTKRGEKCLCTEKLTFEFLIFSVKMQGNLILFGLVEFRKAKNLFF
jgi:hypothetical protein